MMKKLSIRAALITTAALCFLSTPAIARSYNLLGIASIELPKTLTVNTPKSADVRRNSVVVIASDPRRGCLLRVDNLSHARSDMEYRDESLEAYQSFVEKQLLRQGGTVTKEAYGHDINGLPAKTVEVLAYADGNEVPTRLTSINLENHTELFVVEVASRPGLRVPCFQETAKAINTLKKVADD